MKFNSNWLFNLYREEASADGAADGASTTAVETETDNTDAGSLLTSETDSEDATASDDTTDTDGDSGNDTDGEGSQTAPESYADFVMPEGVTLDEALMTDATEMFKDMKLTQEQAQTLVDFQAKQAQASSQSQVDTFNQLMKDWQTQAKNDKEFGGDKFDENIAVARTAIDKFGTPELKQLLEEHGVGNHPEVIRFMVNVGKLTAEDVPGNNANNISKPTDRASLLYPTD